MTLPFEEEIVNDCEYSKYNFENPRFIGYLNKYGEVFDYSKPLGIGGHNDNKLTTYFEYYFRMPTYNEWIQQTEGKDIIYLEYEQLCAKEERKYFKKIIKYKADLTREYGISEDPNAKFKADLDRFFYNCYQADTFMEGFGQNCMSLNEPEFFQQCRIGRKPDETEEYYLKRRDWFFRFGYRRYQKKLMLDWYKTVIVQYMGYHLVERCKKGITTSCLKPYETFYNYLLNDFTIHQIPHMIYDNNKKMYIKYEQNQFLVPDSELRLKQEIQSIKKLVPLNGRSKYYR